MVSTPSTVETRAHERTAAPFARSYLHGRSSACNPHVPTTNPRRVGTKIYQIPSRTFIRPKKSLCAPAHAQPGIPAGPFACERKRETSSRACGRSARDRRRSTFSPLSRAHLTGDLLNVRTVTIFYRAGGRILCFARGKSFW